MPEQRKKRVLFHSNYSRVHTGFGKNLRNILLYLAKKGKYELIEASNGKIYDDPELKTLPWKAFGTIPKNPAFHYQASKDPNLRRLAYYGFYGLDDIIKKEKPDIYIGIEDIWGLAKYTESKWWNKINSVIWTTLDSVPLLPDSLKIAPKVKNYWVWAKFAEEELKSHGFNQVETVHGTLDTSHFYYVGEKTKKDLRKKHDISENSFVIGYVFRNQLRKSVFALLRGFKDFIDKYPESNAKLLLHTHWADDGWRIEDLIKDIFRPKIKDRMDHLEYKKYCDQEYKKIKKKILTTYYCSKCRNYKVQSYIGQKKKCPFCGDEKSFDTSNIANGVSEKQLNEVYNLMDLYIAPFTSGGQELPVQEAKLCELPTLVTNYSCGTEYCTEESGGLPLSWTEYRETTGTQFIKAATDHKSIAYNLEKVYKMTPEKRAKMGEKGRKFVIENCSVEVICDKIEQFIDSCDFAADNWDFDFSEKPKNDKVSLPEEENNSDFVKKLYKDILNMEVDESDDGFQYWMKELAKDE